jgi:four helix bundle protein
MADKLSEIKLYQMVSAAQQATEAEAAKFPPFEGLALSIHIKKAAKSTVAHVEEAYGRHNAGDRIRLLGLAAESIESLRKGLDNALKSEMIKQPEFDKLTGEWSAALVEMDTYVSFLETGGEMESPLPGV